MWVVTKEKYKDSMVNFDVEILTTIKKVWVYNGIGNIDLQDITAKIYTETDIGNITGENLNPLDSGTFKVNKPSTEKEGLDVKFSNVNNVNDIITGVESGNIILNLPLDASYTHEQVKFQDINIQYHFKMNSKKQFEYCEEQSLQMFKPISSKHGKTSIKTGTNKNSSEDVLIK